MAPTGACVIKKYETTTPRNLAITLQSNFTTVAIYEDSDCPVGD
jgi:hypothetical protein